MQSQEIPVNKKCLLFLLADEDLYSFTVHYDPGLSHKYVADMLGSKGHNLLGCYATMRRDRSFLLVEQRLILTLLFGLVGLETFADVLVCLPLLMWHPD